MQSRNPICPPGYYHTKSMATRELGHTMYGYITRFFFIRNRFIRNLILDMPKFKKLLELSLKCQFKNKKLLKLKLYTIT